MDELNTEVNSAIESSFVFSVDDSFDTHQRHSEFSDVP